MVGGSKPLTFDKVDKDFWKSDCNYRLDLAELGGFTLMAKPKLTGQYLEGEIPEMPEDITACSLYELADEHGKQALLIRGKWDQLIFISGNTLKWEAFHFESTRKETFIGT